MRANNFSFHVRSSRRSFSFCWLTINNWSTDTFIFYAMQALITTIHERNVTTRWATDFLVLCAWRLTNYLSTESKRETHRRLILSAMSCILKTKTFITFARFDFCFSCCWCNLALFFFFVVHSFFIVVLCVKTTHSKRKSKPTRSHSNMKCRSRDSLTTMNDKKKKSSTELETKNVETLIGIGKWDSTSLVVVRIYNVFSFSVSHDHSPTSTRLKSIYW